jgi:multidrug efflux pump subunit AcrB
MHVSEFAVTRWQFTLTVFLGLAALGIASFIGIPKAEDPTIRFPSFGIVAVLPGAGPTDIERLVVDPIESRIRALDDVKTIRTQIEDSVGLVMVEFVTGSDPAQKRDAVVREMASLRASLPAELRSLDVNAYDPAKVNVLQLALVSETVPARELDTLSRQLKKRLEEVPGVDEATVHALPRQELQIVLDPERMAALGVAPAEVLMAVSADAQSIPAGSVDAGARVLSAKTSGDYASVDEVASTVVRIVDGRSVLVRDLATVALGDAEPTHLARFNGKRAVLVAVNMMENQDLFEVRPKLEAAVGSFASGLPPTVSLQIAFDQATNVEHRLGGLGRDFALAILLVLVTLLPLGLRASLVVMVSIPLSLAVGVTLLNLTGYTINQATIVGFVIALGLMVDDSVVVIENITRHIREGVSPRTAAICATKQIALSVIGCTATLVFAFFPLLALPGGAGMFIRPLPAAVVFAILASLVVSLTIVPFLSSIILRGGASRGNLFHRGLVRGIEATYRPILHRAIAHPAWALGIAVLLFAGGLMLIPRIGFSLFPKSGLPQFVVTVEAPEGASLAEADRGARFVEGILARHPEIRRITANVGKGNPMVYYNRSQRNELPSYAEVLAEAKTRDTERLEEITAGLRAEFAAYAGAEIELHEFENGAALDAPLALRVLSDEPSAQQEAASRVEAILSRTEGTRDVDNPARDRKSDLRIRIDRDRAALFGITVPDVDKAVRLAIGGVVVGSYRESASEEAREIRVTLPRGPSSLPGGARPGLEVLDRLYLNGAGGPVPLHQIADFVLEPAPARIYHFNKTRSVTVTAQVRDGYNTDRVTKKVLAALELEKWPENVQIVPAGEYESRNESFGGLGTAIIIAIMGILAILVLEFKTFRSTLIVASVIPLGIAGGLLSLWLSGYTLSFMATIGFVALMGIEVKNSILLVDFTNQLRARGVSLKAAVEEAGEKRFVPILLTTLTAMGGLLPLAAEGSAMYSPLAFVIIGGLVSSTVLSRIVTPVLYLLLPPKVTRELQPAPAAALDGAMLQEI